MWSRVSVAYWFSLILLAQGECLAGAFGETLPHELLAGTNDATPVYEQKGQEDGPTVLIVAGLAGDQPSGVNAAESIRHWRPAAGRLVVIPRVNSSALAAGTALTPGEPATSANLHQAFPKDDGPLEARSAMGRALWRFANRLQPDVVISLEASEVDYGNEKFGTGIHHAGQGTRGLAEAAVKAAGESRCLGRDAPVLTGKAFPQGSFCRAVNHHLACKVLAIEAYRSHSGTTRTRSARQHRWAVWGVLDALGMLSADHSPDEILPPADGRLRVAVYTGPGAVSGSGHGPHWLIRSWSHLDEMNFVPLGPEEVRGGALAGFDLAYFGGGLSTSQGKALGQKGRDKLRQFIRDGGGYVGVCAGFFLLMPSSSGQSLGVIQAELVLPKHRYWDKAHVDIELTEEGNVLLGDGGAGATGPRRLKSTYSGGPVVKPSSRGEVPYEVLAIYREEKARVAAQVGKMIGAPAIIRAQYGQGTIIAHSCHPERAPGPQSWFYESLRLAAAENSTIVR
ncbi:MAG: hypothetical protein Q7Q71_16535 [Verrucomicrobiota bacterium JB023]|nr:hypothetical protein [Verrucomicrobiota bacterium JB023]